MGFFSKWTKKTEKEQLAAVEKKAEVKVGKEKKDDKKLEKVEISQKKKMTKSTGVANRVLLHPVVTEKATIAESGGTYTFAVISGATKIDVKNAIKEIYGVKPEQVRVVNMEGKEVRFGRHLGKRNGWKKAIITLPKGESISIHEGV